MMREGYLARQPTAQHRGRNARVAAHPRRRELDKLVELMHGARTSRSPRPSTRRSAATTTKRAPRACRRSAGADRRTAGRGYVKNRGPAFRTFIREAESIVDNVHLQDERNNPREDADDPDAEATLVLTVGDSGTARLTSRRRSPLGVGGLRFPRLGRSRQERESRPAQLIGCRYASRSLEPNCEVERIGESSNPSTPSASDTRVSVPLNPRIADVVDDPHPRVVDVSRSAIRSR